MSTSTRKRGADEYITKENGSIPNFGAQGDDDKPKMSTTAQQARRKIAQPRGRLGANRSHTAPNNTPNLFSQNTSQQQPFGGVNGGVAFGASQSFPQTSAGTNSAFNFQPPQSSSFTFGAPSETPNPFASLNGTSDAQDISMESPQKKTTFGSNNFMFGQAAQQQTSNPFAGLGGDQNSNTNGTSLFGQTASSAAPSNPFGQSSPSKPFTGFAQPLSHPQPQTTGFKGFGQPTSTSAPSTNGLTTGPGLPQSGAVGQSELPKFVFGQTSSTSEAPKTSMFPSTAPSTQSSNKALFGFGPSQTSSTTAGPSTTSASFTFGSTSNQIAPFATPNAQSKEEPKGVAPLFGGQAQTSTPATESDAPTPNPFAGLFGGASAKVQPTAAHTPVFSLGQQNQTSTQTAERPEVASSKPIFSFGTPSRPEPQPTTNEPQSSPSNPLFSFGSVSQSAIQPNDSSETQSNASNPMFGSATSGSFGKPASTEKPTVPSETSTTSTLDKTQEASAKSTSATPTTGFKFGGSSQPMSSGGLFSTPKSGSDSTSSGGLFSKLNSAVETTPKTKPVSGVQVPSPFNGTQQSRPTSVPASQSKSTTESSANSSEGSMPVTSSLFGGFSQQPSQTEQTPSASSLKFGAPQSQTNPLPTASFSASTSIAQTQKAPDSATSSAMILEPVKRPVYTKGPSRFPGHTTASQFQEFDRDFRLCSLNYGLQQKLATLDPRSHDFDNIIRHYVAARDNIGAALGLYVRNVAGTKRKGDQVDDREDAPEQNKRSREEGTQASNFGSRTLFGSASAANNAPSVPSKSNDQTAKLPPVNATTAPKQPSGFTPTAQSSTEPKVSATANSFTAFGGGAGFTPTQASTTPIKSPPKKPVFEMPKFGGGGNTNFMAAFGQQAKANSAKLEKDLLEKRKAEDFDSDEDDEESFNKRIEEENRAKRAKIDSIAKGGFTPTFAPAPNQKSSGSPSGTSNTAFSPNAFSALAKPQTSIDLLDDGEANDEDVEDDEQEASGSSNEQAEDGDEEDAGAAATEDEEGQDSLPEDEVVDGSGEEEEEDDDDNDLQAAMDRARNNPNAGKSLFDRIEPNPSIEKSTSAINGDKNESAAADSDPIMQPAKNSSFPPAIWGSHFGKSTPDQPSFSPFTPTAGTPNPEPASTFKFAPATSTTPTPGPGASIFSGGLTKDGPVPGEGLFGSRPSTPTNPEKNGSLAKSVLTSPAGTDNTWKAGTPISFANGDKPTSAPVFKFTAPSPSKQDESSATPKPFASLFGTPATGASAVSSNGFQLGGPVPAPGFLGAKSHLGAPPGTSSVTSSRATSPGLTDTESVATNETDEDHPDDPQTSLMESRAGEENESCLWEGRSKALVFINSDMAKGTKYKVNEWNSVGVGQLRVLKHQITGKARVVFRTEPNANILLNSHLVASTEYQDASAAKSGAVKGTLVYNDKLTQLVFKVKTPEMAHDLTKVLEDNKNA